MLGEVIRPIIDTLIPEDLEMLLHHPVFKPPKSHVPSLGLLVAHVLVDKSIGSLVISLQGRRRLWVANLR